MITKKSYPVISFSLALLFLFTAVFSPGGGRVEASEMEIKSKAALLMEYDSGEIIFSYNENEKLYPASTTKIMTLLLALEALEEGSISLKDEVPVTEHAASMGGSELFLSPGDVVEMEYLLIGIAVHSGNDASVAVAEYLAGSEEAFAESMNRRAQELGMENTHFVNASGLHHEEHYTSAYDLALLSRKLLEHPIFFRWSKIWMDEHFLEGKIKSGGVYLSNTNRLIYYYQGCDGIKTGYTSESLHSIVATAKRNGTRFIAVILNGPTSEIRYEEAKKLLNHGFANFYSILLLEESEKVMTLPVEKGSMKEVDVICAGNLSLLLKKGEEVNYSTRAVLPARLKTPLKAGEAVGTMQAVEGEKVLKEVPLIITADLEKASFRELFWKYLSVWLRFGR
jgi:D-alanyl-D-alanine carboxypeptidase (penicillin-binding protein 5/6)